MVPCDVIAMKMDDDDILSLALRRKAGRKSVSDIGIGGAGGYGSSGSGSSGYGEGSSGGGYSEVSSIGGYGGSSYALNGLGSTGTKGAGVTSNGLRGNAGFSSSLNAGLNKLSVAPARKYPSEAVLRIDNFTSGDSTPVSLTPSPTLPHKVNVFLMMIQLSYFIFHIVNDN